MPTKKKNKSKALPIPGKQVTLSIEQVLKKALQAPPREGREGADEGRKKEINELLKKIAEKKS